MKKLFVGLASGVHERKRYEELFSEALNLVVGVRDVDYIAEPITSFIELGDQHDVYILLLLTGGTSELGYKLVSSARRPAVLIASGENNALASALSIRSKLERASIKNLLLTYIDLEDFRRKFEILVNALEAANDLRNLKILEINESGKPSELGSKYVERVGGFIDTISFEELVERARSASTSGLDDLLEELKSIYGVNSDDSALKIASLIRAAEGLVEERGYDAVSIDCFPLILKHGYTPCMLVSYLTSRGTPVICENDWYSLPLMYIARRITGSPGWIANPSGYTRDGYLRFAHCTIAYSLGLDCRAVDHFESGRPYGVACKFKHNRVAFARLSEDFRVLRVYRGAVVDSGLIEESYCRTQLVVKANGISPRDFYREALGNHHVFLVDRNELVEHLEVISWWMNWKLETRS